MTRSKRLIFVLAVAALLLPLLALPGGAAAPGGSRSVRIPAAAVSQLEALGLRSLVAEDYGSFLWLTLSAADHARLVASSLPLEEVPDAGLVRVNGYSFDPLQEGEPAREAAEERDSGPGFRLVQLVAPVRDRWLGLMEAAGLEPLQYYPHNAFLVWGDREAAERIAGREFVRWVGNFYPAYKVNDSLQGRSGLIQNVDVMFYDDGDIDATLAAIAALGGRVLRFYPAQPDRAFYDAIVELDAGALQAVANLEAVLWLGYSSPEPGLDDEMSTQIVAGNHTGGVPATGYLAHLADLGYDGSGVTWAIVDTGIDYDHPDLGSHIAGGYDFPGACSYSGRPGNDCPGEGHGTHVAGIVGGDATAGYTDGNGFLYGLGMAPEVGLYAMNSLSGSAWPPAGGWQEHSKRGVLGGAIGGNNSWTTGEGTAHGYQSSERTHDLMVRDGNFDTADVAEPFVEVFSAGNSGPSANTLTAPKEAKNLIVAASSRNYRAGDIDAVSSFSSRGPAVDGRWVPTVAAPGESIASARSSKAPSQCSTSISGTDKTYALCSGTSMAAPHVSGSVALIADWWADTQDGAVPSPAMAKALLVNGAVDMGTADIPNIHEGWGRIDVTNVISPSAASLYVDQTHAFHDPGEPWTLNLEVADPSQPLKVSLAWTDAAGAVGANPALVNDLNLAVSVGGITYLGNAFSGGWSTSGGAADALNNLENVYVQGVSGSVTISVEAVNLPGDGIPYDGDATDQDFALVCFNCVEVSPCVAPAVPQVSIARLGTDVQLTWPAVIDADHYQVWRSANNPYFLPGESCLAPDCSLEAGTSYVDQDAVGLVDQNITYRVRSVAGCGAASAGSQRVGEFDYAITPAQ